MPNPLQIAAFIGPSALTIYAMIKGRAVSLNQFRRLARRSTTLKEWNAVYLYLNLPLEKQNEPIQSRHDKPTRLVIAGVLVASSITLFLLPLPYVVSFRLAQYAFDLFPSIKSLISGVLLALSLVPAIYRPRRWLLSQAVPTEYPFRPWKEFREELEKK